MITSGTNSDPIDTLSDSIILSPPTSSCADARLSPDPNRNAERINIGWSNNRAQRSKCADDYPPKFGCALRSRLSWPQAHCSLLEKRPPWIKSRALGQNDCGLTPCDLKMSRCSERPIADLFGAPADKKRKAFQPNGKGCEGGDASLPGRRPSVYALAMPRPHSACRSTGVRAHSSSNSDSGVISAKRYGRIYSFATSPFFICQENSAGKLFGNQQNEQMVGTAAICRTTHHDMSQSEIRIVATRAITTHIGETGWTCQPACTIRPMVSMQPVAQASDAVSQIDRATQRRFMLLMGVRLVRRYRELNIA